jgi:hypothetical protein
MYLVLFCVLLFTTTGCLRTKIFDTSLVNSIYNNLIKRKLLICNANINFNRTCLAKRIIPNFVNFGVSIIFLL